MKRETEDGAENTAHLKVTSSAVLKIYGNLLKYYKLSKHLEEQNVVLLPQSNISE